MLLFASACITVTNGRVRPGLMRDLTSPRRDPNPIADPNEELRSPPDRDSPRDPISAGSQQELMESVAATIAGVVAGAMPMIIWTGTFDENRLFDPRARRDSRKVDASPKTHGR